MEYFLTLICIFIISLFLKWKFQIKICNSLKEVITLYGVFFVVGIVWDSLAVWRGHWTINKSIFDFQIGILPIEEYLFFLIIPFFCLVVYNVVKKLV